MARRLAIALCCACWPAFAAGGEPAPASRLLFAPTGRTPAPGHGTLGLTEGLFPWLEVGVTDRVSVFAATALPFEAVVLGAKLQVVRTAHADVSAGVFSTPGWGGVAYGAATFGGKKGAFTVGYGWGYGDLAESEGPTSLVLIGFDVAASRRFHLIGEAYVGGGGLGLPTNTIMAGGRLHLGRFTADLGVVMPIYSDDFAWGAPLVTVAWEF